MNDLVATREPMNDLVTTREKRRNIGAWSRLKNMEIRGFSPTVTISYLLSMNLFVKGVLEEYTDGFHSNCELTVFQMGV